MKSLQERHLCCFVAEKLQSLLGPGVQIVYLAWGTCAKTMKSHWPNNKNLEQEFSGQKKMKFVFISRSQFANPNIPFPS